METGSPGKRPVLPKRARLLVTAGMGMLALLLFGPRLVDIYVDWLWFGEVGFRSVWITVLLTRLAIVAAVALVVAGIVLAALLLAYRSRPFFVPDEPQRDPVAPLRSAVMRRPRLFGWGIAVTLGVVCGLIASFDWVKVQLFVHGGTFGIVDPEFGYDIGFFVFDLPFYRSVLNWLFVAVVLAFLASLLTHYLFGGLRLTTGRGMLTQAARVQLAVFAGAVVLLKAVAYDPRPATNSELDDLRHSGRLRAHPAGTVKPDSLRQPLVAADRRRRRALCGTALHRADLDKPEQFDFPATFPGAGQRA